MARPVPLLLTLFLLGTTCVFGPASRPAWAGGFEMILLLDESGSMKKTDPNRARCDAAELFLKMCSENHSVGLMGFSTSVRVLGDPKPMGPGAAREHLETQLKTIRSDGQWTDIETALRQALDDLVRLAPSPTGPRAVLLMTDGKVDRGEGAASDLESVASIRGSLVAEFIQENVELHCLAFSSGADLELLEYLSRATHGLAVRGNDERDLQRLFLRLFEEIAEPQAVPLAGNKALLDEWVREVTFLIIHEEDTPVHLTSPGGSILTQSNIEADGAWFSTSGYDLITLSHPKPGHWGVEPLGDSDQDRVLILTDVELELDSFPNAVRSGATVHLLAKLSSAGETVHNPEIVSRLVVSATLTGKEEELSVYLLDDGQHRDGLAGDGLFAALIPAPEETGFYDIEIIARAPTLERRIVRSLSVVDCWFEPEVESETIAPGEVMPLKVRVTDRDVAHTGRNITFQAVVQQPGGVRKTIAIAPVTEYLFTAGFTDTMQPGHYRITVTGRFTTKDDADIEETVGPLAVSVLTPIAGTHVALPAATPEPEPAAHQPEQEPEEQAAETEAAHRVPDTRPATHWSQGLGFRIVAGVGLSLLAAAVVLLALLLRRRTGGVPADAPSMDRLRERVAEIHQEGCDLAEIKPVPPEDAPTLVTEVPETPESDSEPEPTELEAKPELPAPETITTQVPEETPPDDAEIIPQPSEAAPEGESEEAFPEGVLIEDTDAETEVTDALDEEPTVAGAPASGASDAEADGLSDILREPEPADGATPPELSPAPELVESKAPTPTGESMSEAESNLLADILGETSGDVPSSEPAARPSSPEPAAPLVPPEPAGDPLSDTESDLLSEIMGEVEGSVADTAEADRSTPTIPHEADSKSDQEVIDDILKDIEGLM